MREMISLRQVWPCDWDDHIKDRLSMPPLKYGQWSKIQEPNKENGWELIYEKIDSKYSVSDLKALFCEYLEHKKYSPELKSLPETKKHDMTSALFGLASYVDIGYLENERKDPVKIEIDSFFEWLEKKER